MTTTWSRPALPRLSRFTLLTLGVIFVAAGAGSVRADTTYSYVGSSFTNCFSNGLPCESTALTGNFVTSMALAPGTTTNLLALLNDSPPGSPALLSFSFTGGGAAQWPEPRLEGRQVVRG